MGGDALPYSQGLGLLALTLAVYYAPPLERTPLHQTRVEVLFWPLAYAFGAYIHLCLPTSPLIAVGIAPERPFAAAMVGFAALFGAATQQRRRRERLKSMAARIDLDQGLALTPSVRARVATLRIRDLLQQRAGLLHGLLEPFLTGTRSDLCDALAEVAKGGPADLVSLIHSTEVDLGVLIQHGQEGVAKILRQSVQIMGVTEKATLIDALQRQESDFRANEELQDCALDALRSTHGAELLRLKNLLDSGGDVFSLHRLVYLDMSEEKRRVALAHFQREAAVWAQARFIKGMPAESLYPERSSTGRDAGAVAGLRTARTPRLLLLRHFRRGRRAQTRQEPSSRTVALERPGARKATAAAGAAFNLLLAAAAIDGAAPAAAASTAASDEGAEEEEGEEEEGEEEEEEEVELATPTRKRKPAEGPAAPPQPPPIRARTASGRTLKPTERAAEHEQALSAERKARAKRNAVSTSGKGG